MVIGRTTWRQMSLQKSVVIKQHKLELHQVPITAGWTEVVWNEKSARYFYTWPAVGIEPHTFHPSRTAIFEFRLIISLPAPKLPLFIVDLHEILHTHRNLYKKPSSESDHLKSPDWLISHWLCVYYVVFIASKLLIKYIYTLSKVWTQWTLHIIDAQSVWNESVWWYMYMVKWCCSLESCLSMMSILLFFWHNNTLTLQDFIGTETVFWSVSTIVHYVMIEHGNTVIPNCINNMYSWATQSYLSSTRYPILQRQTSTHDQLWESDSIQTIFDIESNAFFLCLYMFSKMPKYSASLNIASHPKNSNHFAVETVMQIYIHLTYILDLSKVIHYLNSSSNEWHLDRWYWWFDVTEMTMRLLPDAASLHHSLACPFWSETCDNSHQLTNIRRSLLITKPMH